MQQELADKAKVGIVTVRRSWKPAIISPGAPRLTSYAAAWKKRAWNLLKRMAAELASGSASLDREGQRRL